MLLSISVVIFILDQWTKRLALSYLAALDTHPLIPGVFHLTLVCNTGAAFGIFKGGAFFFILVSVISILAILLLERRHKKVSAFFGITADEAWTRGALGLILGGACGNLWDRLFRSYVVDFLDFRVWPVFNVADSAITAGGVLIFWRMFRSGKRRKCFPS